MPVAETEKLILNMGPQHPATHGVLRVILELRGETILKAETDIGFLHRGMEKIAENLTYTQFLPYTDRIDYVAAPAWNLAYVEAVEKLMGIEVPERAKYMRTIMAEISRISSHLIGVGSHALDIGAMTVFIYCFRERELTLDLFEHACGSRMLTNYCRFGGVMTDFTDEFLKRCREFVEIFPSRMQDYEDLLTQNRIWLKRTKNVAVITAEEGLNLSMNGPNIRGSGVAWDVRKAEPYAAYDKIDFDIALQSDGDAYARYLVRLEEMRQANRIIKQALNDLPDGDIQAKVPRVIKPPKGEVFVRTEAPKGDAGFYIESDGSDKPYRLKIRTPSFANLESLPHLTKGHLVADVVTAIGSIDIVLGEIDR
jgi:NADH:ubiquinone oxidoreductase subunit D